MAGHTAARATVAGDHDHLAEAADPEEQNVDQVTDGGAGYGYGTGGYGTGGYGDLDALPDTTIIGRRVEGIDE